PGVRARAGGLPQPRAGVLDQRAAGLRRRDTLARAHQQGGAERLLQVTNAGRGGAQRDMRAFGAVGDAARLDHVPEQVKIDEIEMHGNLPISRRLTTPDTHCRLVLPDLASKKWKASQSGSRPSRRFFGASDPALRPAVTLG